MLRWHMWWTTYHHNLFLLRAAMIVGSLPLAQRCRLRDISVGVNGGRVGLLAQGKLNLIGLVPLLQRKRQKVVSL